MRPLRSLILCASFLLVGCSDPTSASIASSVSGTWEMHETVPGAGFWMTLAANGSSLSGTGVVLVEAGGGGSSTIQGAVDGTVVNLDFTLVFEHPGGTRTIVEHFIGHLILDELVGTMQSVDPMEADPVPTVFIRQQLTPI